MYELDLQAISRTDGRGCVVTPAVRVVRLVNTRDLNPLGGRTALDSGPGHQIRCGWRPRLPQRHIRDRIFPIPIRADPEMSRAIRLHASTKIGSLGPAVGILRFVARRIIAPTHIANVTQAATNAQSNRDSD